MSSDNSYTRDLKDDNDDVMKLSLTKGNLGVELCESQILNENSVVKQFIGDFAVEILPRLKRAALNKDWLKYHKITNILTISLNIRPRFPESFVYKVIAIKDSEFQNISKYFDETFMFIQNGLDQEDRRILVHCEMGISRSPSVVIAYIMRSQKKSLKDALAFVQERRPIVMPNQGFYKQLEEFETELSLNNNSDSESKLMNQIGKNFIIDYLGQFA
ncbi:28491_t:CDS:2 [Dentiscutata erythropus]|uniref:protein-tyrosine-phosphatase n=1 Tax=Dentiscutata erythropus TaxID=1348616 RepID=A0A9N9BIG9_9GLOM|nr:28491_t:CDS:2 [Dentiscutata erythropus]